MGSLCLYRASRALGVGVNASYPGVNLYRLSENVAEEQNLGEIEIMDVYYRIEDRGLRKALLNFMRAYVEGQKKT